MPTKGVDRAAMREAILRRYRELKQRNPTADCFRQAVVETIPKGALAGYHKILEWMSELRQALQNAPLPRNGIWPTEFAGQGQGEHGRGE
ncbi:MAG TPA: hypothetical protein VJJ47_01425 [Candidatus Paceibacterota bacterium]